MNINETESIPNPVRPSRRVSHFICITDKLAELLDVPNNLTMSNLIKNFIKYIKNNNLVKPDRKHIIHNDILIDMFDLKEHKPFAYYNLVKHLKKHIIKID